MDRDSILLSVVLVFVIIVVVAMTQPKDVDPYGTYRGNVVAMTTVVNANQIIDSQIEILATNDLPKDSRGPWRVSIETKVFQQIHIGQLVEFKFLNPVHSAIEVVRLYP